MKRNFASQTLILTGLFAAACWVAAAQQKTINIKKVPVEPTTSMDGKTLFHKYCAVCHGETAKGDGPAAEALKKRPADLTQITRKNNGKFPEIGIMRVIKGEDVVAAHGTRDMPTWGDLFTQMSSSQDVGQARVYALMKYLEEMQAK